MSLYERLPGKGRTFLARHSLWLGDDHLLAVENNGYAERYRRYFFRDTQAFLMRRTIRNRVWNIVISILIILSLIGFGFADAGGKAFWGVAVILLVIPLVINIRRGPTCICWLQMPLATQELKSLRRVKTAEKVLSRLRPLIAEAQASLGPVAEPGASATFSVPPMVPNSVRQKQATLLTGYTGGIHRALFILLIVDVVLTPFVYFSHEKNLLSVLNGLLTVGQLSLVLIAIIKQTKFQVPKRVRILTWSFLVTFGASFILGAGYSIGYAVVSLPSGAKKSATFYGPDHVFLNVLMVIYMLALLFISFSGLLALRRPSLPQSEIVSGTGL